MFAASAELASQAFEELAAEGDPRVGGARWPPPAAPESASTQPMAAQKAAGGEQDHLAIPVAARLPDRMVGFRAASSRNLRRALRRRGRYDLLLFHAVLRGRPNARREPPVRRGSL